MTLTEYCDATGIGSTHQQDLKLDVNPVPSVPIAIGDIVLYNLSSDTVCPAIIERNTGYSYGLSYLRHGRWQTVSANEGEKIGNFKRKV